MCEIDSIKRHSRASSLEAIHIFSQLIVSVNGTFLLCWPGITVNRLSPRSSNPNEGRCLVGVLREASFARRVGQRHVFGIVCKQKHTDNP